ncbi:MAG: hypothetical protein J6X75_05225 [Clostridia bacterium]|nr:hypothetical protein [Clostridia bacterium]
MIDYALKPPLSQQEINIEKINNTNDYLTSMNPDEQKIFTKSYKYPYLAGEILSHDYPFLLDKIINIDFYGQENNTIGGELSMIKNTSNVDDGDEGGPDDSMGEFRNPQEPQEEDIDNTNNNTFFNTTIDNNLNNDRDNLELIDYLFNISFSYDLNPIQGGYLVKINRSLLHSLYNPNKSNAFINYICFKKPNDLISNFWNKIQFFYFQEIIYDILMFCEEDNNQNNKLDIIKNNILTKLIILMKTQSEGIKDILCDYALNCKGVEALVNENFISKLCGAFATSNNEKILENFCIVTGHIIKLYKNDNFSSSKNIKPFEKNNIYNNFLNNSLGILNLGDSDMLIGKVNSAIKEINLAYFNSTNSKIIFITFIYDFMALTRCQELLDNLILINFFSFLKNLFFSSKNDIIQSLYINMIQLLIEDSNEKWINELLFKNNFIEQALNIKYNNLIINNFGLKDNELYVHLSEIFDILIKNTFLNEFLKKNNLFEKINNIFNNTYKNYSERMEKTICNFKCNSLYLPAEDSLRVDEIAEKGDIKNIGDFNRFNNNIFKKNSFSSSVKKEIFFDGQPEGDIEKREDNFDDDTETENKNIIQEFPCFEEDTQKEESKNK